ncbi:MAG: type III polyketide synthase [Planctomycetaceae bacterium]|nr:type III polyketide synthase [Planctomycetaceae bacterium]
MSFAIHGIGTAHPPEYLTPEEGLGVARFMAGPDVRTSTWLGPVYANSGNNRRYLVIAGAVVRDILNGTRLTESPFIPTPANDGVGPTTGERMRVYAEFAGPLALRAAITAMAEAKYHGEEITHLVTVSCTGFLAPGVDLALICGLKLRPTVQRTHVGFMGCHGAMNGLRVANAFATADPNARVLVAAVELCSLHYYYGNAADKLVANAIFADGAAAIVGCNAAAPVGRPLSLVASGSCVIPGSIPDMAWTLGDHGFEMTLSRRVPGLIAKHLRPWLEMWLSDNGLSLAEVKSWAVHPGGPKIVSAVEESLGLTADDLAASRGVFADHGNMSSPTVLFVLDRLRQQNAPRPCVALGFGPGLVAEAALFM